MRYVGLTCLLIVLLCLLKFYLGQENCDCNMMLIFMLPVNLCEERKKKKQINAELKDKSVQSQSTGVYV